MMKSIFFWLSLFYLIVSIFLGGFPFNHSAIFNSTLALILFGASIFLIRGVFRRVHLQHVPEAFMVILILLVAAYLRVRAIPGAAFVGPTVDEPILMVPVIGMIRTGNLDFGTYEYGGVYFYILIAACAYYVLHVVSNFKYRRADQIPDLEFYTAGRYATALFSIATVAVVYLAARKFFGKWQALIAASILSLSFLHISISSQIRLDLALALFVLAAHYFFLRIRQEPSSINYLLAGLFCGLAIGTKYTVVPIFASLMLVHLLAKKEKWLDWNILLGLLTGIGVYFAFNIYAYLNIDQFLIRLPIAIHHNLNPDHWSRSPNKPLEYTWILITQGVGPAGLAAAIITLRKLIDPRDDRFLILWLFPLLYLAMLGSYSSGFDRYLIPVLPNLAILAGEGAVSIYHWIAARSTFIRSRTRLAGFVMAALLIAPSAWTVGQFYRDVYKGLPPQEVIAWVSSNLPHGSKIIADPTGPILPTKEFNVRTPDFSEFKNPKNLKNVDYVVVTEDLFKRIPPRFEVIKEFPARTKSNDRAVRVYRLRSAE